MDYFYMTVFMLTVFFIRCLCAAQRSKRRKYSRRSTFEHKLLESLVSQLAVHPLGSEIAKFVETGDFFVETTPLYQFQSGQEKLPADVAPFVLRGFVRTLKDRRYLLRVERRLWTWRLLGVSSVKNVHVSTVYCDPRRAALTAEDQKIQLLE
jgi:hypothetical protein